MPTKPQKPRKTLSELWDIELDRIKTMRKQAIDDGFILSAPTPQKPEKVTREDVKKIKQITYEDMRPVKFRTEQKSQLKSIQPRPISASPSVDAGEFSSGLRPNNLPTPPTIVGQIQERLSKAFDDAGPLAGLVEQALAEAIEKDGEEAVYKRLWAGGEKFLGFLDRFITYKDTENIGIHYAEYEYIRQIIDGDRKPLSVRYKGDYKQYSYRQGNPVGLSYAYVDEYGKYMEFRNKEEQGQ